MFAYYLKLALRSLKRNKALTVLMVLTIAVGIGATMTTITVFRTLAGDPIPSKSDRLFRVQLDMYAGTASPGAEPPADLSRFDAETLLAQAHAPRQTITAYSTAVIDGGNGEPFISDVRSASADFFPMFLVPMKYGKPWTTNEDNARARVAVISSELNDKLFGGADPIGKEVRLEDTPFRIVGVIDQWRPSPRFTRTMPVPSALPTWPSSPMPPRGRWTGATAAI